MTLARLEVICTNGVDDGIVASRFVFRLLSRSKKSIGRALRFGIGAPCRADDSYSIMFATGLHLPPAAPQTSQHSYHLFSGLPIRLVSPSPLCVVSSRALA